MSEAKSDAGLQHERLFDDRLDTGTQIASFDVFRILGRSLAIMAGPFKGLFGVKIALSLVALIPQLYLPWFPKIVIDQVLLQQPFTDDVIPFPPHMQPFVDLVRDLPPMEIMGAVFLALLALLAIFGRGYVWTDEFLAQGEDSATQSENVMNDGGSDAAGVIGIVELAVNVRLSQRITNHLRTALYDNMTRLPMTTLDDHRIGDAVYRVMYDAPMVTRMCYVVTVYPLTSALGVVIALFLLAYSYAELVPQLIWIASLIIPVALFLTLPFSALLRRVEQNSRAAGAATTNAIEESLSNIAAVQSLGGMSRERDRIDDRSRESFRRYRFVRIVQIGIDLLTFGALGIFAMWLTFFITDHIVDGVLTPGDWGVLFAQAVSLTWIAMEVGRMWINLQTSAAALRRVLFFLDMPTEERNETLVTLSPLERLIEIQDVSFSYPDGRQALRHIELSLKPGELVAIVGPTGAGKTSLAYLIPGFIRPASGRVLFDGVDIADVETGSIRDQVTYVFQEHLLLSESIRENLTLVSPEATEPDMIEALETAGAMEFVRDLPDGIDTVLGRSGDTLSVGQKQRLCIARGLIRKTRALILDEPTAALDPQTENALVRALRRAAKRRLVIVIAHRLSTIRQADRIVFLEDAEIKDVGSHDELMSADSRYRHFVELQGGAERD